MCNLNIVAYSHLWHSHSTQRLLTTFPRTGPIHRNPQDPHRQTLHYTCSGHICMSWQVKLFCCFSNRDTLVKQKKNVLTALCLVTLLQWLVQKQHMKHTSLQHFVTVWWLMLCSRSYSPHQQYSVQLSSLDVRGGSHSSTWSQWVYFAYYLGNCLFYHWATVQNFLNSSFILTQTFRMEMRLLPALRKWGSQQKGFCFELKNKTHINISRSRKKKRKDWEIFSTSSQWTSDNRRLVLLEQQLFFFLPCEFQT